MESKRKSFYLNEQTQSNHNQYLAPKKVKFDIAIDMSENDSIKVELDQIKSELIQLKKYLNQPMIPLEDYLKLESENNELKKEICQLKYLHFQNGKYFVAL